MSHTVIGIFDNTTDAQDAIDQLVSDGFTNDQIDLSVNNGGQTSSYNDNIQTSSYSNDHDENESESGIGKFFRNLFSDDESQAVKYSKVANRGHIVTVHTTSQEEAERAADILDEYGTVDIDQRSNDYISTESYATENSGFSDNSVAHSLNDDETIQVIEENLEVGKKEVQTGSVRVRSRIVERPVEETLRLREERAWIERTPVNRIATESELANMTEETIEVTEYAERPVVSKEAHVVEEIKVGKSVEERQETIHGIVRKTEVDVDENLDKSDYNRI